MTGGTETADEITPGTLNQQETAATVPPGAAEETKERRAEGGDKKTGPAAPKAGARGEARAAQFSHVQDTAQSPVQRGLDFILDIPLQVTVELGRTQMLVNDLLQLGLMHSADQY